LNISGDHIDVNGNQLTIGGYRSEMDLADYIFFGTPCPSRVLRVLLDQDLNATVADVYVDDGRQMSLVSVGILSGSKFLIGTSITGPVMICQHVVIASKDSAKEDMIDLNELIDRHEKKKTPNK